MICDTTESIFKKTDFFFISQNRICNIIKQILRHHQTLMKLYSQNRICDMITKSILCYHENNFVILNNL